MKANCIIIDDEPLAIELIKTHISQLDYLTVVGTFKNAVDALGFLRNNAVDLLFLDIQMPKLSGIEFLKSININSKVIFTTAYREYALDGYELNVVDYLLKPITFNRFIKAVDKYFDTVPFMSEAQISSSLLPEKDFLFVRADRKNVKVTMSEILYVESIKDYIKICTTERTFLVKEKISVFEEQLPPRSFLRVHRSYIVNKLKVTAFTNYDIEINEKEIPIGGLFKEQVKIALTS